jgi:hypothetical protein
MRGNSTKIRQCKSCKKNKRLSSFPTFNNHLDSGMTTGYRWSCRSCRAKPRVGPKSPKTHKLCRLCEQMLPLTNEHWYFTKSTKNGKYYAQPYCIPCGNKARAGYAKSPVEAEKQREYTRRYELKKRGLTEAEYDALLVAQDGLCAICRKPEDHPARLTKGPRRLSIDHCHKSGKIRGLLCSKCNRAIAMLGDDIQSIKCVIAYLEKTSQLL